MPGAWDTGNIIPVHKKGDRTVCSNYRGITLLPVCYKVLALIIKEKLEPYVEEALGEYQCGFRKGRSTIDHIFTIRQMMEKHWEYNKEFWQLFIDFKQAYDSIHRESLWNIMTEMGIPNKLINLVKVCYRNSKSCVQVGRSRTEAFEVNTGLRQGCLLSPMLFNMVLEKVKRSTQDMYRGVDIGIANIQMLAFADDVDVTEQNIEHLDNIYHSFCEASARLGLQINVEKTKLMKMSRDEVQPIEWNAIRNMNNIEVVEDFEYLGTILTAKNKCESKVLARIVLGTDVLMASWIL